MPAVLFVSYSHHDFAWVERIEAHLKPLEKQGLIEVFIDRRIGPGAAQIFRRLVPVLERLKGKK